MDNNIPTLGVYRHYKGGLYSVSGVTAKHHVTGELLVLYTDASSGETYARELSSWNRLVGPNIARFVRIEQVGSRGSCEIVENYVLFVRADGGVVCPACDKIYYDHPRVLVDDTAQLYLARICDGSYVKL